MSAAPSSPSIAVELVDEPGEVVDEEPLLDDDEEDELCWVEDDVEDPPDVVMEVELAVLLVGEVLDVCDDDEDDEDDEDELSPPCDVVIELELAELVVGDELDDEEVVKVDEDDEDDDSSGELVELTSVLDVELDVKVVLELEDELWVDDEELPPSVLEDDIVVVELLVDGVELELDELELLDVLLDVFSVGTVVEVEVF